MQTERDEDEEEWNETGNKTIGRSEAYCQQLPFNIKAKHTLRIDMLL